MRNSITARDTGHISLTIYNGGFGSVNEHRTIDIKQGQTEIIYADVAKKIEIDSLLVTALNVCEFNYDFDLVGRDRLLMKYIDRDVILKDRETGKEKFCRLLSVEEGAVFDTVNVSPTLKFIEGLVISLKTGIETEAGFIL